MSDGRAALAALRDRFATRAAPGTRERRVYIDTFDWRLHEQGTRLAAVHGGAGGILRLESADGVVECPLAGTGDPGLAAELPAGHVRDRVAPIIGVRRLLPVVSVQATGPRLDVLDREQKIVVRVTLEQSSVSAPGGRRSTETLPSTMLVEPMRGYAAAAHAVRQCLEHDLGLTATVPGRGVGTVARVTGSDRPGAAQLSRIFTHPGEGYPTKPLIEFQRHAAALADWTENRTQNQTMKSRPVRRFCRRSLQVQVRDWEQPSQVIDSG